MTSTIPKVLIGLRVRVISTGQVGRVMTDRAVQQEDQSYKETVSLDMEGWPRGSGYPVYPHSDVTVIE
jgi:hypothetical protein